jgi:rhamnulokinase
LVGVERQRPVLTPAARAAGFTNEAGVDGTVRFLKNRTGMWVLEECMREWESANERAPYATLLAEATTAPPHHRTIDLSARDFGERGGMPAKIDAACRANGFEPPTSRGGLVRFILESLAQSASDALDECDALTAQRTEVVHVVGGGARLGLLNQLTAAACGRPVVAGPDEATALGNLLAQVRALGDLPAGVSLREAARNSVTLTTYSPQSAAPNGAARAVTSPSLHGI